MAIWADGDALTPGNMNNQQLSLLTVDGNVVIGTTTPATGDPQLDILGTNGRVIVITNNVNDATNKVASLAVRHYTNAEETATLVRGATTVSANLITYGGGSGSQNAATTHEWYTAANNTTLTGTLATDLTGVGSSSTLRTRGNMVVDVGLTVSGSTIRVAEAPTGGGLAGDATGTVGDITWGSSSGVSFLYVCVSTNSWMRATLNPF